MLRTPIERASPLEHDELLNSIPDLSFDYPRMTFAQIEASYFRGVLTPKERCEAKQIYDQERQK